MALIDAYDTRTGEVRQVPEHWIGHPTLGATLSTEPPAPPDPEPTLGDLTVNELREHAAAIGVDLTGLTKKADIVAAIETEVMRVATDLGLVPEQPSTPVGDHPNQEV
jgi:hypothetical protein